MPGKTRPVLIGGAVMGVLTALPFINLCCCLWIVCGGLVAAYLLQQEQPTPITAGDGALVGLLAGLFGTLVTVLLSIPITLIVGPLQRELFRRMNENPQMQLPPGFEDFGASFALGMFGVILFGMIVLVVGVVFSTLGGLLGAAIFQKPAPPGTAGPLMP